MTKLSFAVLSLTACLGLSSQAATTAYFVDVDTSSINGQMGNLDFLLTSGGADAFGLQAEITLFNGFGGILGSATVTGSAAGSLPGVITLDNGGFADVFQQFQFSNQLRFAVTFSGEALMPPGVTTSGSRFSFSLYAADGVTPLLTDDAATGAVAYVDITTAGAIEVVTPDSAPGVGSLAQIQPVPEPATVFLMAGVGLAAGIVRLRRNG